MLATLGLLATLVRLDGGSSGLGSDSSWSPLLCCVRCRLRDDRSALLLLSIRWTSNGAAESLVAVLPLRSSPPLVPRHMGLAAQ
jgi:hypothetical protein